MIYSNTALVQWHSKKQQSANTSVYGAEFVAMKQGIDTLRDLHYKLRMMGVPILGPYVSMRQHICTTNTTKQAYIKEEKQLYMLSFYVRIRYQV